MNYLGEVSHAGKWVGEFQTEGISNYGGSLLHGLVPLHGQAGRRSLQKGNIIKTCVQQLYNLKPRNIKKQNFFENVWLMT